MGKAAVDFGLQTAQSVIGAGMGMALRGWEDRQQVKQQQRLTDQQTKANAMLMDHSMKNQLQMWKNTNYTAQMAELEKAGLNPGLVYGMGGAGGATTGSGSGGGATGGTARGGGGESIMMAQAAAEMGLMRAQKENIEAQTAKTNAEIPRIGAEIGNLTASTASLTQGIENQKAQKLLIDAQTELAGTQDSKLKREEQELWKTQDNRVTVWAEDAKRKIEETKQAVIQTGVDKATAETKIEMLKSEAAGVIIRNSLMESDIAVNQAEIMKIANEIVLGWSKWSLEERKTAIYERVGKFNSAQSQRTYDNILKGIGIITRGGIQVGDNTKNILLPPTQ